MVQLVRTMVVEVDNEQELARIEEAFSEPEDAKLKGFVLEVTKAFLDGNLQNLPNVYAMNSVQWIEYAATLPEEDQYKDAELCEFLNVKLQDILSHLIQMEALESRYKNSPEELAYIKTLIPQYSVVEEVIVPKSKIQKLI